MLMKQPAEIQRVIISDDMSDFGYRIGGSFQQHLRVGDTDGNNILHGRHSGILLEVPYKPADAHASGGSIFFDAYVGVIIVIKILCSDIHFRIEIFVAQFFFAGDPPVNRNQ